MEIKKNSTTATNLQDLILEGRKILMKKTEGNYIKGKLMNHLSG